MTEQAEAADLKARWLAMRVEGQALRAATDALAESHDVAAVKAHGLRLHNFHERLHQLTEDIDRFHTAYGRSIGL